MKPPFVVTNSLHLYRQMDWCTKQYTTEAPTLYSARNNLSHIDPDHRSAFGDISFSLWRKILFMKLFTKHILACVWLFHEGVAAVQSTQNFPIICGSLSFLSRLSVFPVARPSRSLSSPFASWVTNSSHSVPLCLGKHVIQSSLEWGQRGGQKRWVNFSCITVSDIPNPKFKNHHHKMSWAKSLCFHLEHLLAPLPTVGG